jgi:zona occludens toxin
MIIFHEGLPRSGKSYEAVVKHIIPAIENGRSVYSNINGLYEGAEKIASLINQTVEYVQSYIHQLTDDEVYILQDVVPKDAMVALDEIQNYYPAGRAKLPKETIKYISEHAQHGHDIILMGQSFQDIAPIWRRRTQRKIVFQKRTGIGKPDSYVWKAYEASTPEKFTKISSGTGKYDSKYFGTYKSHQDGTTNTTFAYEDERTNVLKQKSMLLGVPFYIGILLFAVYHLWGYFTSGPEEPEIKTAHVEKPEPPPEPKFIDYLDEVSATYRLHLSATLSTPEGELTHAIIQALDPQYNLKEQFTLEEITAFGWEYQQKEFGLLLVKGGKTHIVRPFPRTDLYGRTNQKLSESL